tara:strand:- start:1325 stop:2482 length:1158 start_codon:yes stop_codon:yes gene_type:complete
MANRKITAMTAHTAPATDDVLPIVDVSEAAAVDKNKKITVQELFKGAPSGTESAPGIAFEADDGNGIYLAGTDTVAISTGGTQRFSINASGDVTIPGSLTVDGTTTTINSTTLTVDDKNIELGSVATPTDTTADGGGITLKGTTDKEIKWVNSTGYWTFNTGIDVTGEVQCDSLDVDGTADITGTITLHGNLDLQDNDKILLGTGDDLEIYHDSTNSIIDSSTGYLKLTANSGAVYLQSDSDVYITSHNAGETMARFTKDGAVELYHDDTKKLETTADGVDITSTGALRLPVGTTAQRPSSPATGDIRFSSTDTAAEIYNGTAWGAIGGGGATGGGGDQWAVEHDNTITTSYTISTGKNVISAGPLTVNSGAVVTVPSGSNWVIV